MTFIYKGENIWVTYLLSYQPVIMGHQTRLAVGHELHATASRPGIFISAIIAVVGLGMSLTGFKTLLKPSPITYTGMQVSGMTCYK